MYNSVHSLDNKIGLGGPQIKKKAFLGKKWENIGFS